MRALLDGDILRFEIGFASEVGWKHKTDREELPPFDYVSEMLHLRLEYILNQCGAEDYTLYLSGDKSFRYDIAKTKPYKGTRKGTKPWHFDNLSAYMKGVLDAKVVYGIEADDALAIDHLGTPEDTIICTRDKDLRQVPGWHYSWELGQQPSFGPLIIEKSGNLNLTEKTRKLTGTGLLFFYSQLLTGDTVDNIPGLPGCGPVKAYNLLKDTDDPFDVVSNAYNDDELLLEQAQLLWIVRKLNEDGSPVMYQLGMEE